MKGKMMDALTLEQKSDGLLKQYLGNNKQVAHYSSHVVENDVDGLHYLQIKVSSYVPVTAEDEKQRDLAFLAARKTALELGWKDHGKDQMIQEDDPEYGTVMIFTIALT